ncbi:MAG: S9 family peptidase [Caulobacterales bacterium]
MTATFARFLRALVLVMVAHVSAAPPSFAEPPPLSLYGNLPGFERAAISPSGDHIAIVGVVKAERQLMVFDKDKKLLLNAAVGDMKVWGLYWAGEDKVLLRSSSTMDLGVGFTAMKTEAQVMMVVPLGGGAPWVVFQKNKMVGGGIRGFYGLNEKNGRWYGYFGGMTYDKNKGDAYLAETNPVLYEVDLLTQASKLIARRADGNDSYRTWLVGLDGQDAATLDFNSRYGDWRISTPKSGVIAAEKNPRGGIDIEGFGPTGESLIYSREDESTGEDRLYDVPLSGGPAAEFLPAENYTSIITDNRTRRVIGHRANGDDFTYNFFDPQYGKVMAATQRAFPGRRVELIDWNASFDRLIVRTDGPSDPVTWWLVDYTSKSAVDLGYSYPMRESQVGPMRLIAYKAADGLDINAVLTLPPGREAKNLPVIVLPHGGPSARDYPGFDWWAQAFASRGYAVLQPNFRGSSGYGAAFQNAGDGEWGRKMQTDISDGLAFLAQQGVVDPKRACIMGGSYGGYAALAGVTLQQGLYRCAVSFAGVGDLQMLYNDAMRVSAYDQTWRRQLNKEIGKGRNLTDVSPRRFAERADAPVLLIHGKDDTVVEFKQSVEMAEALRRLGKPVEFVTLKGGDHWLSTSETRLAMLEAAMTFVQKYNPPDP